MRAVTVDALDAFRFMDAPGVLLGNSGVTLAAGNWVQGHRMHILGICIRMAGGAAESHLPVHGAEVSFLVDE